MDKEKIDFLIENMELKEQLEVFEILIKHLQHSYMWEKKMGRIKDK